jgi:hypothetical protein
MMIKFEKKKKKRWIILDWRANLKRKINSTKEIKEETIKRMRKNHQKNEDQIL